MIDLNKVLDDLVKVSQGDLGTLSRATEDFKRDITQANRIPSQSGSPTEAPLPEPAVEPAVVPAKGGNAQGQ